MIACGIETSGLAGSVALADEGRGLLAEVAFEKGIRHGRALIPSLEECLRRAGLDKHAIDLYAVGVGPGSYTGLRVGVMTGKALAFALRKPLVGVPSFDALAAEVPADALAAAEARSLVVAADARRDRIYVGAYDPQTRARRGEFSVRPAAGVLDGLEGPVVLAGAGLERYPDLLARAARFVESHAPARAVARLGLEAYRTRPAGAAAPSLHDVKPLYLRSSLAAEE